MDNKIPDKIKDQHIIVDKSVISKIANAASLTEHDSVLEIGSGPGNLTKAIAAHAGQVYAIEKDYEYIMELKKIFGGNRKVMVIEGNALDVKLPQFNKIVSNPPYKILQPFFLRLLHERKYNFECCVTVAPHGFSKLALAKAQENLKCSNLTIITWDYEGEINVRGETAKCIPLWKWLLQ